MAPRGTDSERILALEQLIGQLRRDLTRAPARVAAPSQIPSGIWPGETAAAITGGPEEIALVDMLRFDGTTQSPADPNVQANLRPIFGLAADDVLPDETPGLVLQGSDRQPYFIPLGNKKASIIRFTLAENMSETTSGQASATVDDFWDGGNPATGDPERVVVRNTSGLFPFAMNTAKGYARHNRKTDVYEIIQCDQRGMRFRGTLLGAITDATSTFSVDSLKVLSPPPFSQLPVLTEGALADIRNVFLWTADEGAICDFEWNQTDQAWDAYQVACPSEPPPEEEE